MGLAVVLTDTQECPLLFEQRVLLNVRYWHRYVTDKAGNVVALDRERERIVRAISFGLDLRTIWPDVFELIQAYTRHMEIRGHWESWGQLLNRALTTAQQANDSDGIITLSVLLARLAQRRGQSRQVTSHYRRALRLARRTGNRYEEARTCSNLGYSYTEQGHWQRAEVLCCHALNLFEQLDDDHGRAHTENHLGHLYIWQQKWDEASQHLERACAIWQATGDRHSLMYGLINLGVLNIEREIPDQALIYLEKAREQARQTGEEVFLGTIHLNIGIAYRLKGNPAQAEMNARQADKIYKRFLNLAELAKVWTNLGLAYLDQGKWAESYQYLMMSLKTRRKLNLKYGEIYALTSLVEYDLVRGNRDQALARLGTVNRLIDQYQHVGLANRLQALLSKYRHVL